MTSSARRAVLLLALITAATAQAGDSPWRHSDVPARHFDSSHDWWKDRSSRAALAPMVIESESVQYRYAGAMDTVTVTHETVYRIRDAAAAPRALWLGSVGSEGLDAVLDFEARLVEPAGTEEVGRERLIVRLRPPTVVRGAGEVSGGADRPGAGRGPHPPKRAMYATQRRMNKGFTVGVCRMMDTCVQAVPRLDRPPLAL